MTLKSRQDNEAKRSLKDVKSPREYDLDCAEKDISDKDRALFFELISTDLTADQVSRVLEPWQVFPRQREVLAVHWHPEWIPLDIIDRRINGSFPASGVKLVIPTQHNQIMSMGDYAGVEVDCYSSGFNRKVQLLLHFKADRLNKADVLRSMLEHTFKYRSSQLFELMDSIVNPEFSGRMEEAAGETGASEEITAMVRFYTARLRKLLLDNEAQTPSIMIKNKLITEFISAQRGGHPQNLINRALLLVKAVKKIVKRHFSLEYFFRASEVIEEARGLGGGIVIPHPEQFWPILMADYDVDGWEVWNPQSQEYTQFLISAMNNQNKIQRPGRKPVLVFMGDDTHMSVKIRDPETQERSKLEREIGWQPAWDDVGIRKSLSLAGASRRRIIEEYMERLE